MLLSALNRLFPKKKSNKVPRSTNGKSVDFESKNGSSNLSRGTKTIKYVPTKIIIKIVGMNTSLDVYSEYDLGGLVGVVRDYTGSYNLINGDTLELNGLGMDVNCNAKNK